MAVPLLGLVTLATWLLLGRPPDDTLLWNAVFDIGHIVLFAVATALVRQMLRTVWPDGAEWIAVAWTCAIVSGLAVLSEVVQVMDPTRHPSAGDVVRDLLGAGFYLTGRALLVQPATRVAAVGLVAAMTLSFAAALSPLAGVRAVYRERDRAFPTLLAFGHSAWERALVLTSAIEEAPCDQSAATVPCEGFVDVTFYPDVFAGYEIREVAPNWSAYDHIALCIILPHGNGPLELVVRARDRTQVRNEADGSEVVVELEPGLNAVSIPLSTFTTASTRPVSLTQMRRLAVFMTGLTNSSRLKLGPFKLVRGSGYRCPQEVDEFGHKSLVRPRVRVHAEPRPAPERP